MIIFSVNYASSSYIFLSLDSTNINLAQILEKIKLEQK